MNPSNPFTRLLSRLGTLFAAVARAWADVQTERAKFRSSRRSSRWVDVATFEPWADAASAPHRERPSLSPTRPHGVGDASVEAGHDDFGEDEANRVDANVD